jgi:hypothetical protein
MLDIGRLDEKVLTNPASGSPPRLETKKNSNGREREKSSRRCAVYMDKLKNCRGRPETFMPNI